MAVKNAVASNWSLTTRADGRKYSRVDSTAPAAPSITATVSGTTPESEIDLVVTPGVDANSEIVSHNIYRSLATDGTYSLVTSISGTTHTDANLIQLTDYFYKATTVNAFGLESDLSTVDSATTTSPQGSTSPWPTQDAVTYTPIIRGHRGNGMNTPAGSGRTLGTVHTEGQEVTESRILRVNSLSAANSGSGDSGTLGYCIQRHDSLGGPSTIVFEVSGTIDGGSGGTTYSIDSPLLTIAGESAPSPGIQLARFKLWVRASDVCITHLTSRWAVTFEQGLDTLEIAGGAVVGGITRIVVDHCTVMWGDDETLSFAGRETRVTISNTIIAEGAGYGESANQAQQRLMSIPANSSNTSNEIMCYGCLFAHSDERQPIARALKYAHVNNVNYDWSRRAVDWATLNNGASSQAQFLTLVGNVFINGPSWNGTRQPLTGGNPPAHASSRYYYSDNRWLKAGGVVQTAVGDLVSISATSEVSPTYFPTGLVAADATDVLDIVLGFVGARPGERDSVTARIISEVTARTGTCKRLGPASATGTVSGSTAISASDIPAYAENSAAFPSAPSGGGNWYDITSTGYTKLEDHLHSLQDAVL